MLIEYNVNHSVDFLPFAFYQSRQCPPIYLEVEVHDAIVKYLKYARTLGKYVPRNRN